jgi:dTDP-4-dehydrorhamnose reductase
MTILVTGAGGQVGQELVMRAGQRVLVGLKRSQLDITDPRAVAAALSAHRVRLVINAAAWTAVDRAESEPDACWSINRDGPAVLAAACAARAVPLLHMSTDYVFDGRSASPYDEASATAPLGVYGRSKWAGEQAIRDALPDRHVILRVAWVFGAHGGNFVRTMLRLGQTRETLSVVADQYGAPTHVGAVAAALLSIADRYDVQTALPWGTYHLSGSPVITWHGFAESIFAEACAAGLLARAPLVHPIPTKAYPLPAARPTNSALDCALIRARFGIEPTPWIAGLREVLNTWKRTS